MSQSYGNPNTSPILAATDAVTGVELDSQLLGTSISGKGPAQSISTGLTLAIKLDNDGSSQTITLANHDNAYETAAQIQTLVRALTAIGPATQAAFNNFTARYDATLDQIVLTSGTSPASTSACQVTGGTAAASLKLGTANGGSEAQTGAEVITYKVTYRFSYNNGAYFGTGVVTVLSSELGSPTDVAAAVTLANGQAAQLKVQGTSTVAVSSDNSQLGPVTL